MMSTWHERLARKGGGEKGSALVLTAFMMVVLSLPLTLLLYVQSKRTAGQ